MQKRITAFVTFITIAAVIAFSAEVVRDPRLDLDLIGGAVAFGILGVIASLVAYSVQSSALGAISFIPFLTATFLYPSWPVVALMIVGVTVSELTRKRIWIKRIFNMAQQVLALTAAVAAYRWLGGVSLQHDETIRPLAEVGAVVAFLLLNTLAVASAIALSEQKRLMQVWKQNVSGSLLYDIAAIPFIHAGALVYSHFGYAGVGFVLVLLFGVRQLYHTKVQLEKYNRELLEVLVHTVEMRDPYTSGHSQRVSKYSRIIARAVGLSNRQIDRIAIAALLHDVGKIHELFAPILSKPGKLTSEERALMELHPLKSVELVEKVSELQDILPAVRHHHENWDGTGYPDKVSGRNIPLGARIIMFADTIDAMTTDRPYRKAMGEAEVRAELIRMRGRQFDPDICDALLASPLYPALFAGEDSRGTPTITQIFDFRTRKRTPAVA